MRSFTKAALQAARACCSLPHETAALTSFVAHTRAREAPTEPHLPPLRRRPLSPIPFCLLREFQIPDRGERWSRRW
jgi:hypothetical protein